MIRNFQVESASELWKEVIEALRDGAGFTQESRAGTTNEILHAFFSLKNPRQRWIAGRTPAMNVAFAIVEVIWILAGRNDSAPIDYFNRDYKKFAGVGPTYHGAYGYRLRRQFNIDQLLRAYETLRSNPNSRQVVLQFWDPASDLPNVNGEPASLDIPCNICSLLKVRNEKLEWLQVMRSNDVVLGLPHNLVQFTSIQEILAGWLGLDVGSYNHVSDSLHIYERNEAQLQNQKFEDAPENLEDLRCDKAASDGYLNSLSDYMDKICCEESVSGGDLVELEMNSELPEAYRNMLCVLCAEGARRRGDRTSCEQIMDDCTSAVFKFMFGRWLQRIDEAKTSTTEI